MWAAVEDEITRVVPARRIDWADVEYRSPIDRDTDVSVASRVDGDEARVWLLTEGVVLASVAVGLQPRSVDESLGDRPP